MQTCFQMDISEAQKVEDGSSTKSLKAKVEPLKETLEKDEMEATKKKPEVTKIKGAHPPTPPKPTTLVNETDLFTLPYCINLACYFRKHHPPLREK